MWKSHTNWENKQSNGCVHSGMIKYKKMNNFSSGIICTFWLTVIKCCTISETLELLQLRSLELSTLIWMTEVLNNLRDIRHVASYKTLNNRSESEFSHIPNVIICTFHFLLKSGKFQRRGFPLSVSKVRSLKINLCVYFKQKRVRTQET